MKNVAMKGPVNARRTSLSSFFITYNLIDQQHMHFPFAKAVFLPKTKRHFFRQMSNSNSQSKITLSETEFALVRNSEWFFTKATIINKVFSIFNTVLDTIRPMVEIHPAAISEPSPKIFKGENYKGLPWVMLDYPRLFSESDVCAIRVMFWWGNYFVITLHLKGKYKDAVVNSEGFNLPSLKRKGLYCYHNSFEWEHDLARENYIPVDELELLNFSEILTKYYHFKLAKAGKLEDWESSVDSITNAYIEFLDMLKLVTKSVE
jgi:hypothetical protein